MHEYANYKYVNVLLPNQPRSVYSLHGYAILLSNAKRQHTVYSTNSVLNYLKSKNWNCVHCKKKKNTVNFTVKKLQ